MPLSADDYQPIELPPLEQTPLVSVLLSTYNRAAFLSEALDSVLAQTYSNWELLVCDDGSTDSSRQILQDYQARDRRIRAFFKENGGQSSGFNVAFKHSSGKVICLLDSDDTFLPRKIERLVQEFRANPKYGLVWHSLQRINEAKQPEGIIPLLGFMDSGWKGPEMLRQAGILNGLRQGGALAIRRTLADLIFPLPETAILRNFGDTPIMRLAPLMAPVAGVKEVLATFRKHSGNQSSAPSLSDYLQRELRCYLAVWELQRDYLATRHPDSPDLLAPLTANGHYVGMTYLSARLRGDLEGERQMLKLMRQSPSPLHTEPRAWRILLTAAPFVPMPLVVASIKILTGQGRIKQFVASLKNAWRGLGSRFSSGPAQPRLAGNNE
jgi:glycosyltransferase involved in cell wall biosynthesis